MDVKRNRTEVLLVRLARKPKRDVVVMMPHITSTVLNRVQLGLAKRLMLPMVRKLILGLPENSFGNNHCNSSRRTKLSQDSGRGDD
ncbi:hypothetical protein KIN20_020801 [Parelaphostrongylus tenuis]|uniref:Uncharacterized protein n=1 Tax=Parelaphostrongylus tenuis TaxID=148309 RepID=A0AAD5QR40_PARTN|nr:hypothetical protein KIN20_020801 [Parelaphostrongylus tenuis]